MFSEDLDSFFADCDVQGNKLEEKYLLFRIGKGQWRSCILTHEFVIKIDYELLASFIRENLNPGN